MKHIIILFLSALLVQVSYGQELKVNKKYNPGGKKSSKSAKSIDYLDLDNSLITEEREKDVILEDRVRFSSGSEDVPVVYIPYSDLDDVVEQYEEVAEEYGGKLKKTSKGEYDCVGCDIPGLDKDADLTLHLEYDKSKKAVMLAMKLESEGEILSKKDIINQKNETKAFMFTGAASAQLEAYKEEEKEAEDAVDDIEDEIDDLKNKIKKLEETKAAELQKREALGKAVDELKTSVKDYQRYLRS